MKKIVFILLFIQTSLFANEINVLDVEKKLAPFHLLSGLAEIDLCHSLKIQITERQHLHICPVSDRPFLFRITPPNSNCYFYALFTFHTFPLELVMTYQTVSKILDEINLVVGESNGELGPNLSRENFVKYGLVMNKEIRQKFLESERDYMKNNNSSFISIQEKILATHGKWLDNWYSYIPASIRQILENNKNLLFDKELLPQLHPALVINKIQRDLEPKEQTYIQTVSFGMDSCIRQLANSRGITITGLESERDVWDAGELEEMKNGVKHFMENSDISPLQDLQRKVREMTFDQIEALRMRSKPQRPYWAECDSPFKEIKAKVESEIQDYFHGKVSAKKPSESVIKRNRKARPGIKKVISTQSRPWLFLWGLDHALGKDGHLEWFASMNHHIERITVY